MRRPPTPEKAAQLAALLAAIVAAAAEPGGTRRPRDEPRETEKRDA